MIASENIVSAGPLMAPPRCAGWGAHGAIRARVPKNGRNFALGRPFLTCSPNPETALRAGRLGPISCAFSAPPSAPENSIVSGLRFVGFVKPRDGRCFFLSFFFVFGRFFLLLFLFPFRRTRVRPRKSTGRGRANLSFRFEKLQR